MTRNLVVLHVLRIGTNKKDGQSVCGRERVSWVYDYKESNCLDCVKGVVTQIRQDHEEIERGLRRRLDRLTRAPQERYEPLNLRQKAEVEGLVKQILSDQSTVANSTQEYREPIMHHGIDLNHLWCDGTLYPGDAVTPFKNEGVVNCPDCRRLLDRWPVGDFIASTVLEVEAALRNGTATSKQIVDFLKILKEKD